VVVAPPAVEEVPPKAKRPIKTKKLAAAAAKLSKPKKVPAPRNRGAQTHPPYFEMIKDAVEALKERTGSSHYAIAKFIGDKQKSLPPNFKKILLLQLKKFVANGKLVKVKSSFKLPAASARPRVSRSKPKPKPENAASISKPKPAAKANLKRKATEKKSVAEKKVAKTAAKSSPGKKIAAPRKPPAVRKSPAKPKTVKKSPGKKAEAAK
ncbi:hypothetical protein M569_06889, partial [Genlisea aurea]